MESIRAQIPGMTNEVTHQPDLGELLSAVLDATGTANSVQVRINSARASLGQLSSELNDHQETSNAFLLSFPCLG